MTIRKKLWLITVVVFLVILTMSVVTYVKSSSMMIDLMNKAGAEYISSSTEGVNRQFEVISGITSSAAASIHNLLSTTDATQESVRVLAASLLDKVKYLGVGEIYLGWETDGMLSAGSGWVSPPDYDARKRGWYKEALAAPKGSVVFTTPYIDAITGQLVITASEAIYEKDGKLLGAVGCDVDLSGISSFVLSRKILGYGNGVLIMRDGMITVHANKDYVLQANMTSDSRFSESLRNAGRIMTSGEAGYIDYSQNNENRRIFYAPVGKNYSLGVFFPTKLITNLVYGLTVVLLTIAATALVITGSLIFAIMRGLARALKNIGIATAKISKGDLTVRFADSGRDELADMSRALNGMVDSVSAALSRISDEADNTSLQAAGLAALSEETLASMQEVSASIDRVNRVMTSAASAIEETNASISEIASSAQASANAATDGAGLASELFGGATEVAHDVENVVISMKEAELNSEETREKIGELAKSVETISGFVSTITSIADQTNLLALNAAIEAARAGEAGRGFAVVAEEVRKLAEESAEAAMEVNKLILTLQGHSEGSIASTGKTVSLLSDVVKKSEDASLKLHGALSATNKLNEAIQSVAAVSEEQAASSSEMTHAVQSVADSNSEIARSTETIRASAQETTKAAESIATAAQGMTETAGNLKELLAAFILPDKNTAVTSKALAGKKKK